MNLSQYRKWIAARCDLARRRPPWERSPVDDVLARRPWNLMFRALRLVGRFRSPSLREGVTVVIVTWNTRDVTADVVAAVRRLSSPNTHVLVIDNASSDGTASLLGRWPGVRCVRLPANVGHGVALDIAMCLVRTRHALLLDSDAVPLTAGWMEPVLRPLTNDAALLCGSRSQRNFVHPMYLAVDVASFLRRNWSFQVHRPPSPEGVSTVWGENAWDTAELLTARLGEAEVAFVERTPCPEGLPGMIAGDVVYHHGGVSRAVDGSLDSKALDQWREACRTLGVPAGEWWPTVS